MSPSDSTLVDSHTARERMVACLVLVIGTLATMVSIDLVLPAIPALPSLLGGDAQAAQYVLATYMGGSSIGLILFGSIAQRFDARLLLGGSLLAYAAVSLLAAFSTDIWTLNAIRVVQGATSAGAAVLPAPMLRRLFTETGAVRAVSVIGSIQSLVPGLAPLIGAWLLHVSGWQAAFIVPAVIGAVVGLVILAKPSLLPENQPVAPDQQRGSYLALFRNRPYLRYALSHSLILGGLITFVFSAPYVMVETMGSSVNAFVVFQLAMVGMFIVTSNLAGFFVNRVGPERLVTIGTLLVGASAAALLVYALAGGSSLVILLVIMLPVTAGLGLRGGVGFVKSLAASAPDEGRGSAALMLAITLLPTIGTALVAPFIQFGLPALAIAFAVITLPAVACIYLLPRFEGAESASSTVMHIG
ncbi:MFS transporter [Kaistia sp. 32K]|uniref:MFS transporter n=1 Tax=Kaistia sp. 32K TaxID=2795690 RepID=UPI001914FCE2|nr:MFS transporter [Kaistia sp. 32K]BCP54360.1 MFS transporter [Kaistia sp. 32K]